MGTLVYGDTSHGTNPLAMLKHKDSFGKSDNLSKIF